MCDVGTDLGMIAGGGIGFAVGGPAGAAIGASLGGSVGHQFDGSDGYQMQNPGQIDIAHDNPEMYKEIQYARDQRDQMTGFEQNFLDPSRYQQMSDLYSQRASTSAMNRAAQMGMGGSSVGMGMANEAAFNTDQAMINRQLQDHMQIAQMNAVLNGGISNDILGVQNQFSAFQNGQMQAYNAAQAQNNANTNQMLGSLGSIGGMMAAGGMAGGGAGAGAAGAGAAAGSFNGYQSSNFGYMSGVPSDYSTPSFGQSSPYYGGGGSSYGLGTNYGSIY